MTAYARAAYVGASIATASPARLLVMLYERLVLDVQRALAAQHEGDHNEAHRQLVHAQDIVMELRTSLDVDAWEGGPAAAALYDYLHTQLVKANVGRDPKLTTFCLKTVTDLCSAWQEAALQHAMAPGR